MRTKKPSIKTQPELLNEVITPYVNPDTGAEVAGRLADINPRAREYQRSLKDDDTQVLSIGIKDIDEAIIFYFNNVIQPSVDQGGVKVQVPILMETPERWAAVQANGEYRDKNGKVLLPFIILKRDLIEKNRKLGNKMDANTPNNFGIFEKKYTTRNAYDRFDRLNNRIPVGEYYVVAIPDYVTLTYSCTIQTEKISQMNKIIEAINYASDSYWGDPSKFKFRAVIDQFKTEVKMPEKGDRTVQGTFSLLLYGYTVPDSINASIVNVKKVYSKAAFKFGVETVVDIKDLP